MKIIVKKRIDGPFKIENFSISKQIKRRETKKICINYEKKLCRKENSNRPLGPAFHFKQNQTRNSKMINDFFMNYEKLF